MKIIAKITVFLTAVTALEASPLGSPSEVRNDSSSRLDVSSLLIRRLDLMRRRCCSHRCCGWITPQSSWCQLPTTNAVTNTPISFPP
jgi:hypothetical protein